MLTIKKVNCNTSSKHKMENIQAASAVSIMDSVDASLHDLGNAMCSTIIQMTLVRRDHLLQSKLIYRLSYVRPYRVAHWERSVRVLAKLPVLWTRELDTWWQEKWGSLYLFRLYITQVSIYHTRGLPQSWRSQLHKIPQMNTYERPLHSRYNRRIWTSTLDVVEIIIVVNAKS